MSSEHYCSYVHYLLYHTPSINVNRYLEKVMFFFGFIVDILLTLTE